MVDFIFLFIQIFCNIHFRTQIDILSCVPGSFWFYIIWFLWGAHSLPLIALPHLFNPFSGLLSTGIISSVTRPLNYASLIFYFWSPEIFLIGTLSASFLIRLSCLLIFGFALSINYTTNNWEQDAECAVIMFLVACGKAGALRRNGMGNRGAGKMTSSLDSVMGSG